MTLRPRIAVSAGAVVTPLFAVWCNADSGLPATADQSGRTTDETSKKSSKIPMLRSRSASLSRPGSRCSRPPSRTDHQPTGNSDCRSASSSRKKTRPNSSATSNTACDQQVRQHPANSAASAVGRKSDRKSPTAENLDRETAPEDNAGETAVTDTSELDRGGDGTERVSGVTSLEDIRTSGGCSSKTVQSRPVRDGRTSSTRYQRRSCSLDRSKPFIQSRCA